jgi:hypothetical protein
LNACDQKFRLALRSRLEYVCFMDQATVVAPVNVFAWIGVSFRDDQGGTRPGSNGEWVLPPPDGMTSDQFAAFMDAQSQA